jgi:hypothetical protein
LGSGPLLVVVLQSTTNLKPARSDRVTVASPSYSSAEVVLPQCSNELEVDSTTSSARRLSTTAIFVFILLLLSSTARPMMAEEAFKAFRLKTVEGQQKNLSDVLGAKATLIVFFYPTCTYCNAAAPELQRLYDTYKTQGLSMVWINSVPREARLITDTPYPSVWAPAFMPLTRTTTSP